MPEEGSAMGWAAGRAMARWGAPQRRGVQAWWFPAAPSVAQPRHEGPPRAPRGAARALAHALQHNITLCMPGAVADVACQSTSRSKGEDFSFHSSRTSVWIMMGGMNGMGACAQQGSQLQRTCKST